MNCTQFTAGINCESCIEGYYRPHKVCTKSTANEDQCWFGNEWYLFFFLPLQVSPYEEAPCYPCECDPFGSVSPVCVVDDKHAMQGIVWYMNDYYVLTITSIELASQVTCHCFKD